MSPPFQPFLKSLEAIYGPDASCRTLNPLSWWLERKLAATAELACDDGAIQATGRREIYAEVLFDIARRWLGSLRESVRRKDPDMAQAEQPLARFSASPPGVPHRVGRILTPPKSVRLLQ